MVEMQRKKLQTHSAMPTPDRREKLKLLLDLCHQLGNPALRMAILGEGNASAKLSDETFLVKASGCSLPTLDKNGVVECRAKTLLTLLETNNLSDAEVDGTLLNSRLDPTAKKPSVEALFHAWLLSLPGIEFVGHTHAQAVNSILCSPRAQEFAAKKIFPDEIVCCDVESVFIPYTDPGRSWRRPSALRRKNLSVTLAVRRASFSWKTTASSRWGVPSRRSCRRC